MEIPKNIIERAFEVSRDGSCRSMADVRKTLEREGFSNVAQHLSGASIKKQLMGAMR